MLSTLTIFQRLCIEWRAGLPAALLERRRALPKWYALPGLLDAGVVTVAQNVEWSDADAFAAARETVLQYGPGNVPQSPEVVVTTTRDPHRADPDGLELAPTPLTGIPTAPQRLKLRVGRSPASSGTSASPGKPCGTGTPSSTSPWLPRPFAPTCSPASPTSTSATRWI